MRRTRPDPLWPLLLACLAPARRVRGFTLIEMIVVMTITGILVAIVATFIRRPMEGVIDTVRRAALADEADSALRRMRRDIQSALPNSVRVVQSGAVWWIEFLPVLAAGRYCAAADCGSSPLDLAAGNLTLSFPIGAAPVLNPVPANSSLAIYNLGIPGADAYAGNNTQTLTTIGTGSTRDDSILTLAANRVFPLASPANRYFIIGQPVSYACNPAGTLTRITGYAVQQSQPVATPTGGVSSLVSNDVSACTMDYNQAAIDRNGLLYMTLTLTRNNESVSLTHAIQVNNTP